MLKVDCVDAIGCIAIDGDDSTGAASFAIVRAASGPGAGWFFLVPMFLAGAVVTTLSKLTKHAPYFGPTLFWGLLFFVPGFVFLPEAWPAGLVLIGIGALVLWIGRRAEAWKQRMIAGG